MKIALGMKFTGKWFTGNCVVKQIDNTTKEGILTVAITSQYGQTRYEEWNLMHTEWGFEQGDYTITLCDEDEDSPESNLQILLNNYYYGTGKHQR